jgi:hypothetical protein
MSNETFNVVMISVLVITSIMGLTLFLAFLIKRHLVRLFEDHWNKRDVVHHEIGANYFGLSEKGSAQIRGNGVLVLTREALEFLLLAPRTRIVIPLTSITAIETPRSHLGKGSLKPLLQVHFEEKGTPLSVAWMVRDLERWRSKIRRYAQNVDRHR